MDITWCVDPQIAVRLEGRSTFMLLAALCQPVPSVVGGKNAPKFKANWKVKKDITELPSSMEEWVVEC